MVLPLNHYDIDGRTGDYDTVIKPEYRHCLFCGRLVQIIDGMIICDGCGHRERRD